ncbi:MAG: hypothetical protein ACKOZN_09810, partial [Cyanobium sp.]
MASSTRAGIRRNSGGWLTLHSWLEASGSGLNGEARLDVRVSQPPLLRLSISVVFVGDNDRSVGV